jgi:hypothetical protein
MVGPTFCLVEAVVVVLALAVGGLLVVKNVNRDERRPVLEDWPPPRPSYELALARTPEGTWASTAKPPEDSTLTVTLVVPWEEVGERYRGLNVVVR